MSDLFDLFGTRVNGPVGAPFTSGSDTSREAAESVAEVAGKIRRQVYRYIVSRGDDGTTDDAAEEVLDLKHTTYTARSGEVVKQGLVRDSGFRDKTRSGRNAALWVAVPEDEVEDAKLEAAAAGERKTLERAALAILKTMSDDDLREFVRDPVEEDSDSEVDMLDFYSEFRE